MYATYAAATAALLCQRCSNLRAWRIGCPEK
jgi:hypothetical protein